MTIINFFCQCEISGKVVYIVDDHHKALAAWAAERHKLTSAPYLLTIDHHTDTDAAFRGYVCIAAYENHLVDENALAAELIAAIDWSCDVSASEAIGKLRHDDHTQAATNSDS